MSVTVSPPKPSVHTREFRGSLVRTVVLWLLGFSLLPVLVVGGATYFRSRTLLRDQAAGQLQAISNTYVRQLNNLIYSRPTPLEDLTKQPYFGAQLTQALQDINGENTARIIESTILPRLRITLRQDANPAFDQIMIVLPDGSIFASTNESWKSLKLVEGNPLYELLGQQKSITSYNPSPFYFNSLIIFTSMPFTDAQGQIIATIIGTTKSDLLSSIVVSAGSFFPEARSFYFIPDGSLQGGSLIGWNDMLLNFMRMQGSSNQIAAIKNLVNSAERQGPGEYTSTNNTPVLSYVTWIPTMNMGVIIEVPTSVIYGQVPLLGTFNLLLLTGVLLIIAGTSYAGARSIVTPMTQLAEKARKFSQGDWTQEAEVRSNNEIGLLAYSFNTMVTELSELYRSLEDKVQQRTEQVRTASEVAQLATSSTDRREILQRSVDLVVDRFNYSYASIYLVDEVGRYAILRAYNQGDNEGMDLEDHRVRVGPASLIGWVAENNQARVAAEISDDPFYQNDPLFPGVNSAIAVPIAIDKQVLGVLNVQSLQPDAFDADTVSVFQTLANQIAVGLQNTRLLEATQIDLQETSLLYRASRQITRAQSEAEALQTITATLLATQYVSAIFAVEKDHLSILALNDPKNPSASASIQGITLPLQKVAERLAESSMTIVTNLTEPSEFLNILSFFNRRGCHSAAIFPINQNNQLTKIIVLGSREPIPITSTVMQPYANMMEVVANTLDRVSVLENLILRVDQLQILARVSQAISNETDLMRLYQTLHQQIQQTMGGDVSFLVAQYNAKNNTIEMPYLIDNGERVNVAPYPLGEGLTSHLIRTRQPLLLVKDTEQTAIGMGVKIIGKPAKSWMGVPLIVGGEVIGAMVVQDTEHEERFKENDLNLFTILAPQVATILRNAQLLREMQQALRAYDMERYLLNAHLDNTPDYIYFKDTEGHYIRSSNSYAQILGFRSPEELLGKSDFDFSDPDTAAEQLLEEQEVLRKGQPVLGIQQKSVRQDGVESWTLTTRIPVYDRFSKSIGTMTIRRDITAMKRTEELSQRRAQQLLTAAEIARDTAGTLDPTSFLRNAVNLVRDRFGFYHASIFLLDALGEYAVLKESTGEAGEHLKKAKHRLAVGSQSIVGQSTARRQPLVINDVSQDPTHFVNPLLPETRAELAIPLISGEILLGALDVQSTKVNAFSDEDVNILQILADQLAIAIVNAQLFQEAQETLAKHRLLHQITSTASGSGTIQDALIKTVQGLRVTLENERVAILLLNAQNKLETKAISGYPNADITTQMEIGQGIIGTVAATRTPIRINDVRSDSRYVSLDPAVRSEVAVPIIYGDELMGVLNLESSEVAAFDETDMEILTTLGRNLGAVLANVRLVSQVRLQVERQRQLFEATSKIRRSVDMEAILQTSATEICRALNAHRARIQVTTAASTTVIAPPTSDNGHDQEVDQ